MTSDVLLIIIPNSIIDNVNFYCNYLTRSTLFEAVLNQRAKLSNSLGDANRSIATKKIWLSELSKNRQDIFMPTPAPNQGVCTLPVTLIWV